MNSRSRTLTWSTFSARPSLRRTAPYRAFESLEVRHLLSRLPIGGESLVAPFDQAASFAQTFSRSTGQAVAVNDDGSFAVAYTNRDEPELGDEVYVRRFNADRTPTVENSLLRVSASGLGDQNSAAVTKLPGGGLLVAWYDRGCSITLDENCLATFEDSDALFARRFDAQGEPIDEEPWQANLGAISAAAQPAVAADARGRFAVAWTGAAAGDLGGAWIRYFDAAGSPLNDEDLRLFRGGVATDSPAIAMDAEGNTAVVWSVTDRVGMGAGSEVLGQYRPVNGEEPVALQIHGENPGEHLWPSLDMDATGNFAIAFTQNEVGQDGETRDIYLRRFSAGGQAIGDAPMRVNSRIAGDQERARVAMSADGGHLVVWSGPSVLAGDSNRSDVFAQEFDGLGAPVDSEFQVNASLVGEQDFPSVDVSPEGTAIVVWSGAGDQTEATPGSGDQSDPAGVFLQALQIVAPIGEIEVRGNGVSILNRDLEPSLEDGTLLGDAAVNEGSVSRTFVIHNVGLGRLTFQDEAGIAIRGGAASEFTIEYAATESIPIDGELAFTVSFAPTSLGLRTATVSIYTDDADESPVEFAVGGVGLSPRRPWRNPGNPYDVNGDGVVSGLDALILINHLNKNGPHALPPPQDGSTPPPYYDVNGDNKISALDVLQTINVINARRPPTQPSSGGLPTVARDTTGEEQARRRTHAPAPSRRTTESTDAVFGYWLNSPVERELAPRNARRRLA